MSFRFKLENDSGFVKLEDDTGYLVLEIDDGSGGEEPPPGPPRRFRVVRNRPYTAVTFKN